MPPIHMAQLPEPGCWFSMATGERLATVTLTAADVPRLPAASRATAVTTCEPFAALSVFPGAEYGAEVASAPVLTPSTWNCTPTTPTLSEASAVMVIVPETVALAAGGGTENDGGGGS